MDDEICVYLPTAGANEFHDAFMAAAVEDGHFRLELLHGLCGQMLLPANFNSYSPPFPNTLVDLQSEKCEYRSNH